MGRGNERSERSTGTVGCSDNQPATSKTVFPFLKKGSGKKISNAEEEKAKFDYLKKGEGKLASHYL